ncbi:MAG: rod shape-determining protein RodA [Betaproteobacteria bacterium]|nr:rod shape-determining protein RodA [Betaproteobacteria bacterium]
MIAYYLRRAGRAFAANIDGPLLGGVLLLMAAGLVALYSASNAGWGRMSGQIINMLVALTVLWVAAKVPPHYLMRIAVPVFAVGIVLLIAVALRGEVVNGARRWLNIGITRIQPSELMKIAAPLMLAWYFHRYEGTLKLRNFALAGLILMVPAVLILRQPDLGTALLILGSGGFVIFLAGLPWKIIAGFALAALASAPVVWSMMRGYQRQRVLTLLDPSQDPLGAGYHTIQAGIAVGSGGWTGKGWLNGTQTHLDFIPERTTDFIFAVYAEEFGLLGSLVLLALFLLVIFRGLMIAANAPTTFTRLLAGAITMSFFTYAFVNMGMVIGILPVVGVPLPLISYGGTSLVSLCLGLGILMSIQTHRKLMNS